MRKVLIVYICKEIFATQYKTILVLQQNSGISTAKVGGICQIEVDYRAEIHKAHWVMRLAFHKCAGL